MEGGTLFGLDQDPMTNFTNEQYFSDASTSCAPAFRVLKQLIQRCLTDAVTSGNIFADAMLQHLYRWLCRLHDPALHSMLHKVMQKMFALLVAELRKFGAAIVFASFSKIIIDTGRSDVSAAKAYCDSVIKAVQTRELFEWIELEPLQFWHSLLFMDQDHFILIVFEFMYVPWKYAQEQATHRESTSDGDLCTPSITAVLAETYDLKMAEDLKKKIRTYFTDKLLKIVCDPNLQMKVMNNSQKIQETSDANSQSYSHVQKGDPALEFIKHVCAVLALDQNMQHEVLIMRRNLLKLVHVREFAPEAEFRSLSVSYTLPNVICSYCNDCRDLDLCRDRPLISQEWRCAVPQCGQPYDREAMENALVQIVRQRERLYHLQDLVCLKCHQIKAAHLADHCTCAGSISYKEDVLDFRNKMQVFLNVAVNQKFQLLQECTS
ncbi:hypothetical protein K7X08_028425 [Anisodus acutangulus]|uniref:DNA polymerase epsilon catalytic subunit n=1 Tax=Anisodus acutangulus TaxID=402998 RepID=A0A9Q1MA88_9SOLA|nr:hypothetical protein K7X08_028425 [Anisodus acutangulus]